MRKKILVRLLTRNWRALTLKEEWVFSLTILDEFPAIICKFMPFSWQPLKQVCLTWIYQHSSFWIWASHFILPVFFWEWLCSLGIGFWINLDLNIEVFPTVVWTEKNCKNVFGSLNYLITRPGRTGWLVLIVQLY